MPSYTSYSQVRFSTFNASLNRAKEGALITDLSTPDNEQAKSVAEIIQRNKPDVLLINEFDYDAAGEAAKLFQQNYLSVSQNGVSPIEYPYVYVAPSNTGIPSGFDLDNNGQIVNVAGQPGYGNDAYGFGDFPGQYAFVVYSKYPIVQDQIRTFQEFLWKDMPGALLPADPEDSDNNGDTENWYSPEELEVVRLSSKNHVDLPTEVNGEIIHVLVSHPTPPTFDGPEDRNGTRNHDEIRFWADYINGADYIYDDKGNFGGLEAGAKFVIMGDQNADPFDGDSVDGAINQLLQNPLVNTSVTPSSEGGIDAAVRQGGVNDTHQGNPANDTADFGFNSSDPSSDGEPGNLRVDYVLPSNNLSITDAQVFWLASNNPLFPLGEFPTSDHRQVFVDVSFTEVAGINFIGQTTFPSGFEYQSTVIGGLSSITYNAAKSEYYAISDDQSTLDDARFYTLDIDLTDGTLDAGDVSFTGVTTLLDRTGEPYAPQSFDPEGLVYDPKDNTLLFSSEGFAQPTNIVNPFIKEISLAGEELQIADVDPKFDPVFDAGVQLSGVANNAAFESLTITPDQTAFFTVNEDTLVQDGDRASLDNGGLVRIVKYDLGTLQPRQEFVLEVDPIVEPSNPADAFKLQGVVELLALDNNTLLVLERSFSVGGQNGQGTGFTGLLYEVELDGATDVSTLDSLEGADFTPVKKTLLLNTEDLGIAIDNVEGMTLGPVLPNGKQSLVIVGDNDFNATRPTQFLAFELDLAKSNEVTPVATPADNTATSMVRPFVQGVSIQTLLTIGEAATQSTTDAANGTAYIPLGIPDGQGVIDLGNNIVRLFTNSEVGRDRGYAYTLKNGLELTGARINFVDIDTTTNTVINGGLAYGTIIDRKGEEVTDAQQINWQPDSYEFAETAGFDRFCSANLIEANTFGEGLGFVDNIFLLGEETSPDFPPTVRDGTVQALDIANETLYAVPDLGYGSWESATLLDTGSADKVALVLGDDYTDAPIWLYVGEKDTSEGAGFLERNGLVGGQLYAWVADDGSLTPADLFGTGTQMGGTWTPIEVQDAAMAGQDGYDDEGYLLGETLRAAARSAGAFFFSRPEDVDVNPLDGTQFVVNNTGDGDGKVNPTDLFGDVSVFDVDFDTDGNPISGKMTIIYDGDTPELNGLESSFQGIRNPDNLAWAADGNVYVQEDFAYDFAPEDAEGLEEASIWKLTLDGKATRLAEINRDIVLPKGSTDSKATTFGASETSGIIDVSEYYGNDPGTDFYFTIQAHGIRDGEIADLNLVEGGQILHMTIKDEPFPSMIKPLDQTAYSSTPLFTVGETINGYTPVGILDGLGAYALDENTVRILASHELGNTAGYAYKVSDGAFTLTGARVSYFDVNKETLAIEDAGLAYNRIYDANGDLATDNSFLANIDTNGDGVNELGNGFGRFCSSHLIEAEQFGTGRGLVNTIYFTGEEDGGTFNPVGGAEWALDVETGNFWQVPAMGRGAWENVTEVDTGTTSHVAFILADDSSPFDVDKDKADEAAPIYLYVGEKNPCGNFLERNGLSGGKLYVWVSKTGETTPLEFNSSGSLNGSWVEIDNSRRPKLASEDGSTGYDEYGYPTQRNLWQQAEAKGAFGFSRPEDVATNPTNGSEIVLASTGVDTYAVDPATGNGVDTFGTVYTIKTAFDANGTPTSTDLTILYDGDADPTRALRSPDNLDWADDGYIYVQEDEAETDTLSGDEVLFGKEAANPNEAGIVKINPATGEVTRIANIDRTVVLDPSIANPAAAVDTDADPHGFANGEWESSGILDVSSLFGKAPATLFISSVQAHGITDQAAFNLASRITDNDLVEGGQLVFLKQVASAEESDMVTVGDFAISFDPSRLDADSSGLLVTDTVDLDIPLFEISHPGQLEINANGVLVDEADLLLAPEFAEALGIGDAAGADVGNIRLHSAFSWEGLNLKIEAGATSVTSVSLDTDLLEEVAGLKLMGVENTVTPAPGFDVGFAITDTTDFSVGLGGATGTIRHTGQVTFEVA
jgi:secreted PhoX family phosphatase